MPRMIEQLSAYQNARRIDAALGLVDGVLDRIMPSDEREMAAADAVKRVISTFPLRRWTVVDIKRRMRKASLHTVHCALAYLVLEGEAEACVATGHWGGKTTYCHPDYLEEAAQ